MRRALALALGLSLVACSSAATPTPDSARPASQAATAVALSQAPLVPTAVAGPATPAGGAGAAATKPAAAEGRIVMVRDDSLIVAETGQSRTIFKAPAGGQIKDPVFAPDGKSIAYAYAPPRPAPKSGAPIVEQLLSSDVMVIDVDGSNPRPAAQHDGPGQILETPSWSSDGKAVLYSFYAHTYKGEELVSETLEVRRREIGASAPPATVAPNASNPTMSRDGKWIAFIGEDANEGQSLQVLAAGGGQPNTLVKADRFAALLAPRFSPDGQTIAFSAATIPGGPGSPGAPGAPAPKASGPLDLLRQLVQPSTAYAHGLPWEIWTVPTSGGTLRQLTQINEDTPYSAWSSDAAHILVYGAGGLYLIDVKAAVTQTISSDGSHGGMDWRSGA
jgi:Tol biopolymer transport system component